MEDGLKLFIQALAREGAREEFVRSTELFWARQKLQSQLPRLGRRKTITAPAMYDVRAQDHQSKVAHTARNLLI